MVDENTAVKDKIGRRTVLIIAAASLGSILVVTGLITGILFLAGTFDSDDEVMRRLNAIEGGSAGINSQPEDNSGEPQLLELPDTNRLDTLYHQFAQVFVVNVSNSRKVMQLNLT